TEVPKSGVAASSVIEHLNVVEDSGSKLHPCHPSLPVEKFCLQRSEETLCHRIVVGVSDGSHRTCQGRNEMPQNRRSKVPQKRRFVKSPASVVLLHRGRRGKMTEHAGFQFLLQAIALAANVDGDG